MTASKKPRPKKPRPRRFTHALHGDGVHDDWPAIQERLDAGESPRLEPGKKYLLSRDLDLGEFVMSGSGIEGEALTDVKQELPILKYGWLQMRSDLFRAQDAILEDILALLSLLEPEQKEACALAIWPDTYGVLVRRIGELAKERNVANDERDAAIQRAEEWQGKAYDEALKRSEAEQNATRLATEKLALLEEVKRANAGWPSAIENIQQANEVIRELRAELAKTKNAGTVYEDAAKTWMQAHNDLRAENEKLRERNDLLGHAADALREKADTLVAENARLIAERDEAVRKAFAITAENEKLRGELAESEDRVRVCQQRYINTTSEMASRINALTTEKNTIAEKTAREQREACARFHWQHRTVIRRTPLVTDAPSKPNIERIAKHGCGSDGYFDPAPSPPEEPAAEAIDEWTPSLIETHKSLTFEVDAIADHWRRRAIAGIERRNALIEQQKAEIAELKEARKCAVDNNREWERRYQLLESELEQLAKAAWRALSKVSARKPADPNGSSDG